MRKGERGRGDEKWDNGTNYSSILLLIVFASLVQSLYHVFSVATCVRHVSSLLRSTHADYDTITIRLEVNGPVEPLTDPHVRLLIYADVLLTETKYR